MSLIGEDSTDSSVIHMETSTCSFEFDRITIPKNRINESVERGTISSSLPFFQNIAESKMQLALQCQCYENGVDRRELSVDCKNPKTVSAKLFDTTKLFVMFPNWLRSYEFANKSAGNKNVELKSEKCEQVHCPMQDSSIQSFGSESCISSSSSNNNNRNHSCSPNSLDQSPSVWSENVTVPQPMHNQLPRNENYVKTNRKDVNCVAKVMHKQQHPDLSSTKIAKHSLTTGADLRYADGQFVPPTAAGTTTAISNEKYDINMCCKYPPPASKPSFKIVQRSPLSSHPRAYSMQILFVILILNRLCSVDGNLMSRNTSNEPNDKRNQSHIGSTVAVTGAATPLLDNGTSSANSRKGVLSTTSPLIPHSIMSANNRSRFQSHPNLQSQDNERMKHLLHQHAQGALTSNTYTGDEPPSAFKLPSGDDNSEEFTRCTSCQFREQLKAQNLASIKMHILARLSMKNPPNITGRPHISEHILQTFYRSNDDRYIRLKNDSLDKVNDMQGDDPSASADNQHQHRHMHEYRSGGVKTGLHDQHHHHHNHHTRIDDDYNEEYDYSDRGGIVYNMDYYDDPRISSRLHYDDLPPYDNVEETDDVFFSTTDVIYSFPKLSKARHRGDILEFTIKNSNHLSVSGATFNLYVRGEDWINANDPNVWLRASSASSAPLSMGGMHVDDNSMGTSTVPATPQDAHSLATSSDAFNKVHGDSRNVNSNQLSISINRFVHRHQQQQSTNDQEQSKRSAQPTQQQQQLRYTRKDGNFVGEIPKAAGDWIQFNITLMVSEWIEQQKHQSVNTQTGDIAQEVVIKTLEPWMRQLLVLDTNSKNRPYIEIQTKDTRRHRTKRHLARDCRENDKQSRCCRYPLRVDFRKFGWDWIIAPDIYEAYYCAGECPIGFLPKHPHTYIYSLSSSYSTCCSPRKLSPLSLLYFDDNKDVIHSIIPNMAVEKCGCS